MLFDRYFWYKVSYHYILIHIEIQTEKEMPSANTKLLFRNNIVMICTLIFYHINVIEWNVVKLLIKPL